MFKRWWLSLFIILMVPVLVFAQRTGPRYRATAYIFSDVVKDSSIAVSNFFMIVDTTNNRLIFWDPSDSTWNNMAISTSEFLSMISDTSAVLLKLSDFPDSLNNVHTITSPWTFDSTIVAQMFYKDSTSVADSVLITFGYIKNLMSDTLSSGTADSARAASQADTLVKTLNFTDLGGSVTDAQVPNDITIDSAKAAHQADTLMGDTQKIIFNSEGKSGDHFTLHDRLKLSDSRGIVSNDFAFTGVYDTDLTISMPICSVMFNGRMDTLSAQDITLSADSHVWLYTHKDSTRNVTETNSDPLDFDSAIRDHVVVLGEFYTDANSIRLYLQPTNAADRWEQLYHYERAVHDHYVIAGCEITIPETSRRELRMSSGHIHYGLYHEEIDSVYTYTDTTAFGDSTLVLHWGVGTGNDSTSHTMQMPVDSVFDYTNNQKVAAVSNKWYKALIWLNGRNMAIQMANSASQSNTAAQAQVKDPPPINADNREHTLRLYWLVFQEGHDFSNAILTDVREIHGTASGAVAVADHGESIGLTDDDHPQYLLRTDVYDSAAVAAYDTMLTHDEVDEIIGLNDSLATKATLTQLATHGNSDSTYARNIASDSSRYLGVTKPHLDVSFGDWISDPDFTPSAEDTITVVALMDTIATNSYHPIIKAYVPDDSTENIQIIDIFSPIFDIPPYFVGVDSIVFDYKTGINNTDSCEVNIHVYEFTDGTLNSLDTVVDKASADTWTHDGTLTSLTALTRYDKFIIRFDLRSMRDYETAEIGRMKIYWKEGS